MFISDFSLIETFSVLFISSRPDHVLRIAEKKKASIFHKQQQKLIHFISSKRKICKTSRRNYQAAIPATNTTNLVVQPTVFSSQSWFIHRSSPLGYYTFDNNPQFEDIPEFNVTEDIKQQQEMEALRNSNSMNGLLNSLMSAMNSNPQNGMTPMDVLNACMPSFSNQPNTCI